MHAITSDVADAPEPIQGELLEIGGVSSWHWFAIGFAGSFLGSIVWHITAAVFGI